MLIIGELINGMFKDIGKAINDRDKKVIQKIAQDQVASGAGMLDVNTGPYEKNPKDAMKWLVDTIQEVCEAPLVLDSTKADVIEEGLKIARKKAMINSTNSDDSRLDLLVPMAKKYKASLIGLTMGKTGIPRDKDERMEHAAKIVTKCQEAGFDLNELYLDPIVLPINVAQAQGTEVLESIKEFKLLCEPQPKTVVGLSNASQGTKNRPLINRIYLVMAIANGLSAAILDPLDKGLVDAAITAELILNKNIYCDSFLEAYRKK
ncbi:MAG: dihydropteroate synthase [Candidatus Omnitrophica bacterium]|nr:dihydropteroate synthase [Candidatus Omnitrophota bacterium]